MVHLSAATLFSFGRTSAAAAHVVPDSIVKAEALGMILEEKGCWWIPR